MARKSKAARIPSFEEWQDAVSPCRYYVPGEIHDGMFGWSIKTAPDIEFLIPRLADNNEILLSHVRELPNCDLIIDDEHVDVIRLYLNIMRVTVHADDAIPNQITDRYDDVGRAIIILIENLPLMISHAQYAEQAAPDWAKENHRAKATAYEALLLAANKGDAHFMRGPPKRRNEKWHRDADALHAILREIGQRQGIVIGSANETTRGVAFIDGALSLAGIQHPGHAAISRALSRRKEQQAKSGADN